MSTLPETDLFHKAINQTLVGFKEKCSSQESPRWNP